MKEIEVICCLDKPDVFVNADVDINGLDYSFIEIYSLLQQFNYQMVDYVEIVA